MSDKLTITINIGAEATVNEDGTVDTSAVAHMLRGVAVKVEGGLAEGVILDTNGQRAGNFEFTEED